MFVGDTTLIGHGCKRSNAFSLVVLIIRLSYIVPFQTEAWFQGSKEFDTPYMQLSENTP